MKIAERGSMLTVLGIGTEVVVGGELAAHVTGINIREAGMVTYEVAWWHEGARRTEWVCSFEIVRAEPKRLVDVGFA